MNLLDNCYVRPLGGGCDILNHSVKSKVIMDHLLVCVYIVSQAHK